MNKIVKIGGAVLLVILVAVLGLVVWVQVYGVPTYEVPTSQLPPPVVAATPIQVDLGEKLVTASCADCHLNRQTNSLSGHQLLDIPKEFGAVYSANITQDKTHGIGNWTDAEVVTLLRTGIGRDGRYRLIMPHFVHMSDEDMSSMLAFLHSGSPWVKPAPTPTPAQQPSFLLKALANTVMKPTPLPTRSIAPPKPTETIAYGRYLVVGRYQCFECHSKDFKTNNAEHPEQSEGYLGGGNQLVTLQGQSIYSRNITADPETGIGTWTEAQFGQAMRYGMAPSGPIQNPMPKYSRLTEEEVHALYAYLQSVPKIKNATAEDGVRVATR
ncbi:c-type cytochrome [Hymenobacter profundi]|uniref:Cytochrome c n=1 Tax=Hymenobacter profundi TaxID=1982110 RepID=A0ABS6X0G1_9BACT|nr:c-type cytochrome [Hymenobacter profundi]MBW3129324.1 cytochrome c [Hymenobacter profundi]